MKLSNTQVYGILRAIVAFAAGLLLQFGIANESLIADGSAILLQIITLWFSWADNTKDTIKEKLLGLLRNLVSFGAATGLLKGWIVSDQFINIASVVITIIVGWLSVNSKPANA